MAATHKVVFESPANKKANILSLHRINRQPYQLMQSTDYSLLSESFIQVRQSSSDFSTCFTTGFMDT